MAGGKIIRAINYLFACSLGFILTGCAGSSDLPQYSAIIQKNMKKLPCAERELPPSPFSLEEWEEWKNLFETASGQGRFAKVAREDILSRPVEKIHLAILKVFENSQENRSVIHFLIQWLSDKNVKLAEPFYFLAAEKSVDRDQRFWAVKNLHRFPNSWRWIPFALHLKYEKDPWVAAEIVLTYVELGHQPALQYLFKNPNPSGLLFPDPHVAPPQDTHQIIEKLYRAAVQKNWTKKISANPKEKLATLYSLAFSTSSRGMNIPKTSHCSWRESYHWVSRLSEYQLRGVDDSRFVLQFWNTTTLSVLADGLQEDSRYIRTHVLQVLRRIGIPAHRTSDQVRNLLKDPYHYADALETLGAIDPQGSLRELMKGLHHGSPEIYTASLAGIRRSENRAFLSSLRSFSKKGSVTPESRRIAHEILTNWNDPPLQNSAGEHKD